MKSTLLNLVLLSWLFIAVANAADKPTADKPTGGLDHIALSVSDLDASTSFFADVLGFEVRGRDSKYPAAFMNNGEMSLTLWQTAEKTVVFDRKHNVGLHHLAIKVGSFEVLDALYEN